MSKKLLYLMCFVVVLGLAGNVSAQIDPATVTNGFALAGSSSLPMALWACAQPPCWSPLRGNRTTLVSRFWKGKRWKK